MSYTTKLSGEGARSKKKWIAVRIGQRCTLTDAAQAHRDLEARKTTVASVIQLA